MWYVESVGLVKTPRGLTLDGVQHPRNIFTLWTKAELAAIGIKPASIAAVTNDTRQQVNSLGIHQVMKQLVHIQQLMLILLTLNHK